MRYYKGDIVEIITAKYKSWNDVPSHERGYYEQQKKPYPFIGQRFRVTVIVKDKLYGHMMDISAKDFEVILYRRSLINKIKTVFYFII